MQSKKRTNEEEIRTQFFREERNMSKESKNSKRLM
jgi:hypothetical protein